MLRVHPRLPGYHHVFGGRIPLPNSPDRPLKPYQTPITYSLFRISESSSGSHIPVINAVWVSGGVSPTEDGGGDQCGILHDNMKCSGRGKAPYQKGHLLSSDPNNPATPRPRSLVERAVSNPLEYLAET